ncbi:MAG: hypothetical protein WBF93_12960 [Pirellulales bacterium]|nr:hypothetical protein [Pirellulales bacterium]
MLKIFKRMLLIRCLRKSWTDKDVGSTALALLLALAMLATIALPLTPRGREMLVRAHHLRVEPYAAWSILQFLPSMYSYANRVWVSPVPLDESTLVGSGRFPDGTHTEWVNHYPPRVITFGIGRAILVNEKQTLHYYLQSRFCDIQVDSHYIAGSRDGRVEVQLVEDGQLHVE